MKSFEHTLDKTVLDENDTPAAQPIQTALEHAYTTQNESVISVNIGTGSEESMSTIDNKMTNDNVHNAKSFNYPYIGVYSQNSSYYPTNFSFAAGKLMENGMVALPRFEDKQLLGGYFINMTANQFFKTYNNDHDRAHAVGLCSNFCYLAEDFY